MRRRLPRHLARRPKRLVAVAVLALAPLIAGLMGAYDTASATVYMPWRSGLMVSSAADANAWAGFRGKGVDIVSAYTYRQGGWDDLIDPQNVWKGLASFHGIVVLNQPFWPENLGNSGSLQTCANGNFDAEWKKFGSNLVSGGHAVTVVRLAWEANGTWFQWQASNTQTWIDCFRHVSKAIKAGDMYAGIEWSMNGHASQLPTTTHNQWDLYPGDDYVDIVGLTNYDEFPASHNADQWKTMYYGQGGLGQLVQFAAQHHKKMSVPEWGVVSDPSKQGGYDNPFYVQQMENFFSTFRKYLFYEAYLQDPDSGNVMSALNNPDQNPKSAAEYKALYSAAH